MLRRCSRQQRSQVQTCWPFSTPCAQLRRAAASSTALSPHVSQTGHVVSLFICTVSTADPAPNGIFNMNGHISDRTFDLSAGAATVA